MGLLEEALNIYAPVVKTICDIYIYIYIIFEQYIGKMEPILLLIFADLATTTTALPADLATTATA